MRTVGRWVAGPSNDVEKMDITVKPIPIAIVRVDMVVDEFERVRILITKVVH